MLNRSLINIIFLALFSFGCQSATYTWFSGSIEKAKESAGTKLIMLDFYTPN
jgi:hypothetical protein